MRRCLHALCVGVLVFSVSADAARGCWHLRRCRQRAWQPAAACPPAGWACGSSTGAVAWSPCGVSGACGCDGAAVHIVEAVAAESIEAHVVVTEAIESGFVGAESVIEPAAAEPTPAPTGATDVPTTPDTATGSKPGPATAEPVATDVLQASAAEPEIDLEPVPVPPPAETAVDEPPVAAAAVEEEDNLFTLADSAIAAGEAVNAADEPVPGGTPAAGEGRSDEGVDESADPEPEPANPLDAAARRAGEPARLWVDATGRHAVVGVLVDLRGDGTCRLDTGAGLVEIPLTALRRRDRDYAEQAAARLAAGRPSLSETVAR